MEQHPTGPVVVLFTFVVAAGSGLIFGLASAMQATRVDLAVAVKKGAPQAGSRSRLRPVLVVAEVLLAVIAVTGASQMIQGFRSMFEMYGGYSPEKVLTARIVLPEGRGDKLQFYDRIIEAAAAIPGVESAAVTSNLPGALRFNRAVDFESEGERSWADLQVASADYFRTLAIGVHAGRALERRDTEASTRVAVVSDRFASRYFPRENVVGRRLKILGEERMVVGVVANVQQFWFEKDTKPMVYLPITQSPWHSVYLAVRSTKREAAWLLPHVRDAVRRIDPTVSLHDPAPMAVLIQETRGAMRLTAGMMSVFGALALVLAALGVYGLMAYSVAQRTREFGIRMALGAEPVMVLRMVVRQGVRLALWGIALGLAGGFAMSRAMAGIMYGVSSTSLVVVVGVPVLLTVVAVLACVVPARSATLVDPIKSLRV